MSIFNADPTQAAPAAITLPMLDSECCTINYEDENTKEHILSIDVIMTELVIEDLINQHSQHHLWIEEFAKWLSEKSGRTISASQAWHVHRHVDIYYKEIKKKSTESLTLLSGIMSTLSTEPSPPSNSDSSTKSSQDSKPNERSEPEPADQKLTESESTAST